MDEKTVMSRMERIEQQEAKLREKKRKIEAQIRELVAKKKVLKELEIKRMIRALRVPHDKLYDFLKSGALPSQGVMSNVVESGVNDDEEM